MPEHSGTCEVKVKYQNHNNYATDCSSSLKFGTEFNHVTADTLQMSKVSGSQGLRSRSLYNLSAVKCYKTAADRLTDLNLVMDVVIKTENNCRGVGRPQVAMHRN